MANIDVEVETARGVWVRVASASEARPDAAHASDFDIPPPPRAEVTCALNASKSYFASQHVNHPPKGIAVDVYC